MSSELVRIGDPLAAEEESGAVAQPQGDAMDCREEQEKQREEQRHLENMASLERAKENAKVQAFLGNPAAKMPVFTPIDEMQAMETPVPALGQPTAAASTAAADGATSGGHGSGQATFGGFGPSMVAPGRGGSGRATRDELLVATIQQLQECFAAISQSVSDLDRHVKAMGQQLEAMWANQADSEPADQDNGGNLDDDMTG